MVNSQKRRKSFQQRLFESSIDLQDHNPITLIPQLIFLSIELMFKSIYGVGFIFDFITKIGLENLQSESLIIYCNYASAGYVYLTFILFIIKLFIKPDSPTFLAKIIRQQVIISIFLITGMLAVPIQVLAIQAVRMGTNSNSYPQAHVYDSIIGIFVLILHISMYLYKEYFLACFFPNPRVQWARPTVAIDIISYLQTLSFSILISLGYQNMVDDVILFFVITFLKFLNFFVNWMQLPYYNSMIDGIQLFKEVVIANVYLIASLLGILGNHKGKISFDILFVLTMLGLIFAFYRVRKMQLERVFLKINKGPKDIKMQLVAFVRLCHEKKLHMVVQLQTWILQHQRNCIDYNCHCQTIDFSMFRNITDADEKDIQKYIEQLQQVNLSSDYHHISQLYQQQIQQNFKYMTPVQNEFFISQFLEPSTDETLEMENQRQKEKRTLKRLKHFILQLIGSEIQQCPKSDIQLQFLQICVDVTLKNQGFKAYFKTLQLRSALSKLSIREQFVIAHLKKHLINKMNASDKRFDSGQGSVKLQLLQQLKYEKGFQQFMLDVQSITDQSENLWKVATSKNYRLLEMNALMEQISVAFIKLWQKFQNNQDDFQNPELLTVLARFCDLVLCFELEAESLYVKATSMLNSIKLQQAKGMGQDGNGLDFKLRSQEYLLTLDCSPKCLDKISFVNQKLLNLTGYNMEDINTIKQLMPRVVASFHDEKLINFLKSPAKINGYISVPNAWMIVKQGYAIPIIIKATPHIDVKHDLRFIGQIKLRTDINLPNLDFDQKLQYNQTFVLLTDEYGKIDSISQETCETLGIYPKMVEQGLTVQQIFFGMDIENLSTFVGPQDYQVNKSLIRDLQQQLDVSQPQSSVIQVKKNSPSQIHGSVKLKLIDPKQKSWVKVFIRSGTQDANEKRIYEVIALPFSVEDPHSSQEQALFGSSGYLEMSRMLSKRFMNSSQERDNRQSLIVGSHEEDQQDEEQSIQNEIASLSSATSSQSSKNETQFQLVRDIKEITQFKNIPPIILKLRRALHVFFFTLVVTAFVLLIVNVVDKLLFEKDLQAVNSAFNIQYYISNLRMRFQTLYIYSNKVAPLDSSQLTLYERYQSFYSVFVEQFRETIDGLNLAIQSLPAQQKNSFYGDSINMTDVSQTGVLYNTTMSFQSSCQEVVARMVSYQSGPPSQLSIHRSIFGIKYGRNVTGKFKITNQEQDSYYIMNNLAMPLRFAGNTLLSSFQSEVETFGSSSKQNILIFTMVCISIIIVAAVFMLPLLFKIDNTLSQSLKSWTLIKQEEKDAQLLRIAFFKEMLHQNQMQNDKGKLSKERMAKIMQRHHEMKIKFSQDTQIKIQSVGQIEPEKGHKPRIEEEFKEVDGKQKHKKVDKIRRQGKEKAKSEMLREDSESSESERQQKVKKNPKNHILQESDGERIHRQSQLIALNQYIFSRKLKMASLILLFTSCLCALYACSYILASKIYQQSLDDLNTITTITQRSPCPSKVLFFMVYKYLLNTTYIADQTIGEIFLVNNCYQIEDQIRQMKTNPTPFYQTFQIYVEQTDGTGLCEFYKDQVVSTFTSNATEATSLYAECKTISNGMLNMGVQSAINSLYQTFNQINIQFIATTNLSEPNLESLLFNANLQSYFQMYSFFIGPVMQRVYEIANNEFFTVLNQDYSNVIIMFTIFIVFLFIAWAVGVSVMIFQLNHTLRRGQLSVKMIPATVLIQIKEIEKGLSSDAGLLIKQQQIQQENRHKHDQNRI